MIRSSHSLISALLLFAALLAADHSEIIASGKPEHVLASINVYKTRLPEAAQRLGKPASTRDEPVEDAPRAISRDYIWRSDDCVLTAGTYILDGKDGILYFVSVAGCSRAPKQWRTGRGLQLGMTIPEVRAMYGPRFSGDAKRDGSINYEFRDGTTLTVDFGSDQKVRAIKLIAEVE